jgi:hypothetical protein
MHHWILTWNWLNLVLKKLSKQIDQSTSVLVKSGTDSRPASFCLIIGNLLLSFSLGILKQKNIF